MEGGAASSRDLGIDSSNFEFEGRFDVESSCSVYEPLDSTFHGTAVAAIIGAGGNEKCSVGIAPAVILSSCNILEDQSLLGTSTDISSNSFGLDGCGPERRRAQWGQSSAVDCPFENSVISPCNVCDFSGAELSTSCKVGIASYCAENYKLDQAGCLEYLDLIVGGTCDFNFVPQPVQAELTR